MVAYALGQLFSGKLFDKVGTRIGYVICIGVWGLVIFSSFYCYVDYFLLAFFRTTLGLSEAGNWPGGVKAMRNGFPLKNGLLRRDCSMPEHQLVLLLLHYL